jgi:hypothetical protein
LQSLRLFDDLAFTMQALNLGTVHEFLLHLENDLLRELIEFERTPPNTMFVSAISQLWVYGLYELLRHFLSYSRNSPARFSSSLA